MRIFVLRTRLSICTYILYTCARPGVTVNYMRRRRFLALHLARRKAVSIDVSNLSVPFGRPRTKGCIILHMDILLRGVWHTLYARTHARRVRPSPLLKVSRQTTVAIIVSGVWATGGTLAHVVVTMFSEETSYIYIIVYTHTRAKGARKCLNDNV